MVVCENIHLYSANFITFRSTLHNIIFIHQKTCFSVTFRFCKKLSATVWEINNINIYDTCGFSMKPVISFNPPAN